MEIRQINGYHGTTRVNADNIIAEQHFNESNRDYEWLGTGVYFFAYRWHAEWWITHPRYNGKDTAILVADLQYTDDQHLDLDDPAILESVNKIVREAISIAKKSGKHLGNVDFSGQKYDRRWNFSCNLMREMNPKLGIITYTFDPGCRPGVSGYTQNQKQICVSEHTIIRNIRRI